MSEVDFTYPAAPITEAVIDFRVVPRPDLTWAELIPLTKVLSEEYPNIDEQKIGRGQIPLGISAQTNFEVNTFGFGARSADGLWVYQAQLEGLSVSRLAPYSRWADLRARAERVWEVYSETVKPVAIQRIGLRYINRINIPYSRIELSDFFNTRIELSSKLNGVMSHFYYQIQVPQPDIDCMCVINSTAAQTQSGEGVSVIMDVDLLTMSGFDVEGAHWEKLDSMRIRKNEIFEASITDLTRELFNGAAANKPQY